MNETFEKHKELIQRTLLEETKAFNLYRLEGKILFFDYHSNVIIQLSDVKKAFELYEQYSENYSFKVLLGFGQYTTIEVDARKYSENNAIPTPAEALVIRNLAHRIIARFYDILRKSKHPLKIFKNMEDALRWLRSIDSHEPA